MFYTYHWKWKKNWPNSITFLLKFADREMTFMQRWNERAFLLNFNKSFWNRRNHGVTAGAWILTRIKLISQRCAFNATRAQRSQKVNKVNCYSNFYDFASICTRMFIHVGLKSYRIRKEFIYLINFNHKTLSYVD